MHDNYIGLSVSCTIDGSSSEPAYLDFSDLDLQGGEVLEDLQVLRLVFECVQVALDGLGVVAFGAVQQAVHVPAHVTGIAVICGR